MSTNKNEVPDVKKAGSKGGDGEDTTVNIPKAEYDALVQRSQRVDQLEINLYLLGNNLKEGGFTVTEQGTALQRLGNDIVARIRLTPEQVQLMQQQIQQQQMQQQQQSQSRPQ